MKNISPIILFLLFCISFFNFCTSSDKVEISPQLIVEFNSKISRADDLFFKGSYASLREAFAVYENLLSLPVYQKKVKTRLLKTAMLLTLRENELSIINSEYIRKSTELIESSPFLSEMAPLQKFIRFTTKSYSDIKKEEQEESSELGDFYDWASQNTESLNMLLKEKSESDIFYTYLYITFHTELSYWIEEADDFSRFYQIYPNISLIHYVLALLPNIKSKRILELLEKDPEFYEAYYYLSQVNLLEGKLLSAEKNLIKAFEKISNSISIIGSLAKIYFAFEEFDKSVEFNDKILELAPEYRDALLGKAICLSYLDRNEEAISILKGLIQRGTYLMGESHYWLAWNYNAQKNFEEAWENIEQSKNYLQGHTEVHSLAGIIAFERNLFDEAEMNFKESLKINPGNCESHYYLARIYAAGEDWENSCHHFEISSACYRGLISSLENKILEIQESSFSSERKQKLIRHKKIQIAKARLWEATSFYNAAAGYFNLGETQKALVLAQEASKHTSLKEKAEELITKIKQETMIRK
jgi:tetratricopeptide (TPR) repeat protein